MESLGHVGASTKNFGAKQVSLWKISQKIRPPKDVLVTAVVVGAQRHCFPKIRTVVASAPGLGDVTACHTPAWVGSTSQGVQVFEVLYGAIWVTYKLQLP